MLAITVTSDFICPWCHIGAARLEAAVAQVGSDIAVAIDWAPFELNPRMPPEGMARKAYRSKKFGSWQRSEALDAHTLAASRDDAVEFHYERIDWTPNTFAAHRLTAYAAAHGRQHAVATALLRAYFEAGRNVGERAVLEEIAAEVGLARDSVVAYLDADSDIEALRERIDRARLHVRGVPHFDIGGVSVEGAQPADVLADAIRQADRTPV